jgi:hypothetical protein
MPQDVMLRLLESRWLVLVLDLDPHPPPLLL